MVSNELFIKEKCNGESLAYQLIRSEAICLREAGYNTVYSVLVARIEGDVVVDSTVVYDVARTETVGHRVLKELWHSGTEPCDAKDMASELL